MMLVSVMVYLVIQGDSVGGVQDRTAEVSDLGENSGLSGDEGEPKIAWELYESTLLP